MSCILIAGGAFPFRTQHQQEKLNGMVGRIQSGEIANFGKFVAAIQALVSNVTIITGEGAKGPTGSKNPDGSGGSAQG